MINSEKKRLRAYQRASNDTEAATLIGESPSTFNKWRIRRGLKAKATRGRPTIGSRKGRK